MRRVESTVAHLAPSSRLEQGAPSLYRMALLGLAVPSQGESSAKSYVFLSRTERATMLKPIRTAHG